MFSTRSLVAAAVTAFVVGIVTSLALRPTDELAAPQISADNQEQIVRHKWRMPLSSSRSLPGSGEQPIWLTERVKEASNGSFIIEIFDPGEIVPAFAINDAVSDRKVQAGWTWIGYDQGKIPASSLIAAAPFGMEPTAYVGWWLFGNGRELSEKIYAEHNIKPLLCAITGPETAGWFSEPIERAEDLNGLKIRFAGLGGRTLQRLGASVTMIPAGEIFQALETGVIDATEYSQPVVDQALGFSRIAKFNYFPGWHQPFTATHMMINLEVWEALPAQDQALLDTACIGTVMYGLSLTESLQGPVIEEFKSQGISTQVLSPELLESLKIAADEVMEEEASKDLYFKEVLDSQRAYKAAHDQWRELAYPN